MKLTIHSHETEILDHFVGDREKTMVTSKFGGKGVFLLFTNRCGSNHLAELMTQLPTLTMKGEVFNSVNVVRACTNRNFGSFDDYMHLIHRGTKTPNWGTKVGCVQFDMLHRFGVFDAFEGGSYFVWLKRKNIIAQAVSHYIAHHNLQWASFHESKGETPPYDFVALKRMVRSIQNHNHAAELSLALTGRPYHALWYEDYIKTPNQHLRRIANFIKEPFEKVERDQGRFKKQDDPVKAEYEARFRADARRKLQL